MLLLTPFEDSTEVYARKYSLRSKFQWKEEEEFLWNMWKEDKFWDSIWKHTVVKNQTIATNGITSLEAGDLRIHLRHVVENKQIIATSVTMLVHNMAILESIWNTTEKSQTNATSVILHLFRQAIWERIWKLTVERGQTNATNVTTHPQRQAMWGYICNTQRRKAPPAWWSWCQTPQASLSQSPPPPSRTPVISWQPVISQSSFLTTSSDPFCWLPLSPSRPPCRSHCRPPRTPPSWSPLAKKYREKIEYICQKRWWRSWWWWWW